MAERTDSSDNADHADGPTDPGHAGHADGPADGPDDPGLSGHSGHSDHSDHDAGDAQDREGAYGLLQRGLALIKSRHHAQAAIVLERAAREEPGKGSILEPLGRAYHHSSQFEQARQTFEALLDLDPSAHWAHFALAASLRKLDRVAEARTHLRIAIALSPGSELYRRALLRLGPPPDDPPPADPPPANPPPADPAQDPPPAKA